MIQVPKPYTIEEFWEWVNARGEIPHTMVVSPARLRATIEATSAFKGSITIGPVDANGSPVEPEPLPCSECVTGEDRACARCGGAQLEQLATATEGLIDKHAMLQAAHVEAVRQRDLFSALIVGALEALKSAGISTPPEGLTSPEDLGACIRTLATARDKLHAEAEKGATEKKKRERLEFFIGTVFLATTDFSYAFSGADDPLVVLTAEAHKHGRRLQVEDCAKHLFAALSKASMPYSPQAAADVVRATPITGEPPDAKSPEAQPRRSTETRYPTCVAHWPECYSGGFDPRCCRFPKECSCEQPAPNEPKGGSR